MSGATPGEVEAHPADTRVTRPIVVNRGKQRRSHVSQLKQSDGPLWAEVTSIVRQVLQELGADSQGKVVVPVVILYRKKRNRQRSGRLAPFGA